MRPLRVRDRVSAARGPTWSAWPWAVDALAQGSRPQELALAREDAGAALVRLGNTDAAVGQLDQALGIYERLDAAHDREECRF